MKIHKLNKEGTLAVVIPKDITYMLGWKEGQNVMVVPTEDKSKVIIVNINLKEN